MPRRWVLALSLSIIACAPRHYVQPTSTEPHAVVTVRVLHHERPGPDLRHMVTLNTVILDLGEPDDDASITGTVRVRPEPLQWRFESTFSHQDERTHMETVQATERYPCGTPPRIDSRQCTRQVPRHQWRTDTETIVDGTCSAAMALFAEPGQRYVVQFEYLAGGECHARCFRPVTAADGTAREAPCRAR